MPVPTELGDCMRRTCGGSMITSVTRKKKLSYGCSNLTSSSVQQVPFEKSSYAMWATSICMVRSFRG
jgi:hypothetical protein